MKMHDSEWPTPLMSGIGQSQPPGSHSDINQQKWLRIGRFLKYG
jgi:hypothetical protein